MEFTCKYYIQFVQNCNLTKMKKVKITLLLICFIAFAVSQFCGSGNPAGDLLDIGKVSLARRGGAREHCFNVLINYNIPNTGRSPDIALTTRFFGYYPASGGFDFSVSGARRGLTNTIDINVQINQDARWTSMQVSYLVNSNVNLVAGNFIGNLISLTTCARNNANNATATVETFIPSYRFNKNLNYRVAVFISGFRTLDDAFTLKPVNSLFDSNEGRLAIQMTSNAAPSQQYVFISYVLFPTTTINNFDFSIGAVDQNQANTYRLEGATGFLQTGSIDFNQFVICRREKGCSSGQVLVNGKCQCVQGFVKVTENICRQYCTQNGYINEQGECTCLPGFQFGPNGICRKVGQCGDNEILQSNGICACRQGFQKNQQGVCVQQASCRLPNEVLNANGICECDSGYARSSRDGSCISRCGQNQVWSGNFCACLPGFGFNVFGQCVQVNVCKENEVFQGNSCQCKSGFSKNRNGVCVAQSVCPPGFTLSQNNMCLPNCGQNEQFNTSIGSCQCNFGLVKINNVCTSRCANNQNWDGRRCNCAAGSARINNVCQACPSNSQVSSNGQSCDCPANTILISSGQLFCKACPLNSIIQNGECRCMQGLILSQDQTACINVQPCQNGVFGRDGRCSCNTGFRLSNDGKCVSVCPAGFTWNSQMGGCIRNIVCGANSALVNGVCVCNVGFMRSPRDSTCMACPQNSTPRTVNICDCNFGFQWSKDGLSCVKTIITCPANAALSPQGQCACNPGYQFTPNRQNCLPTVVCPQNGFIGPEGKCVCNNGYYLQSNACKIVPTCPVNMVFDQTKLSCVCKNQGQYLINGACKACAANEYWNTTDCVCKEKLFKINGKCQPCHIATSYNGTDCNCNIGYFGTRDNCQACHPSCGRCSGSQANQCTTCADITLQLSKGYCTKSTPCTIGYYLNQAGQCGKCSDYCVSCVSELECGECATGFKIKLIVNEDGLGYSICQAQCGDGKKLDVQKCDDGNRKNGDGCSADCTTEPNWFCSGGSALKPSKCVTPIPADTKIQAKNAVNMIGKVVQGVRLSKIPNCFTDNGKDCRDCYKILDVKVIQAMVPTPPVVSYLMNTDQFVIEYNLGGAITNTYFKYQIQINKFLPDEYKNCFTQADYAQQVVGVIDSSTLAMNDNTETLGLDDVNGPLVQVVAPVSGPKTVGGTAGSASGYSQKVLDLLFNK